MGNSPLVITHVMLLNDVKMVLATVGGSWVYAFVEFVNVKELVLSREVRSLDSTTIHSSIHRPSIVELLGVEMTSPVDGVGAWEGAHDQLFESLNHGDAMSLTA